MSDVIAPAGPRRRLRRFLRFDVLEFGLICTFIAIAASVIATPNIEVPAELRALGEAYGPHRNSEHYEEWMIRDFFQDRRGGVFLDVGANHYRTFNNTYYLESALGWSGIAVEPLVEFEADYRQQRPRTRFRPFFVSDVSNSEAKLYLTENSLVTSAEKAFTDRYGAITREITAPTITLTDLLDAEGVEQIDFLSMDIELHEPKALAGFDIGRFQPALVCIEAHPEVRQQILDYFTRHDYVVVGKYLRTDEENLYFAPVGSVR